MEIFVRPIVYNLLASNFILLVPAYVSPLVTERITLRQQADCDRL